MLAQIELTLAVELDDFGRGAGGLGGDARSVVEIVRTSGEISDGDHSSLHSERRHRGRGCSAK